MKKNKTIEKIEEIYRNIIIWAFPYFSKTTYRSRETLFSKNRVGLSLLTLFLSNSEREKGVQTCRSIPNAPSHITPRKFGKNWLILLFSVLAINGYGQCSVSAVGEALDCSGTNGKITLIPSGGTAPYTYSIDNGQTSSPDSIFTNVAGGNYDILVIDVNGCWSQTTVHVPEALSLYVINTVENCTSTPGRFEMLPSGGTAPYEYSIDNGTTFSSTTVYTGLAGGYYDVIVRDVSGCIASSRDTVPFPLELASLTIENSCGGASNGSITIEGTLGAGDYVYSFDGGAHFNSMNHIGNISSGTFDVIIKDAAGCTIDTTVLIEDFPPIQPVITTLPVPCNGGGSGEVDVAFSGTDTYDFSLDGGTTTVTGTTFLDNTLAEGSYTLSITDVHGCQDSFPFDIGAQRIADSISKINEVCNQDNGEIHVSGYLGVAPYQYSIDNGTTLTSSGDFTNLNEGVYYVQVVDDIGCTKTDTLEIVNFGGIDAVPSVDDTICEGSSAIVGVNHNAGSGVQYQWDHNLPAFQQNMVTPLTTTTYTVVVTDVFGCKDTADVTVFVDEMPNVSVSQTSVFACLGDSLILVASGANSYEWSTGWQDSVLRIEVDGVTTYTVIGKIGKCSDEKNVDVIVKPSPTVYADANVTSINTHDSIFFYSTGSTASSYSWDFRDGYSSLQANPYHKFDFAGAYMVMLTGEMGGCEAQDSVLVYVGFVNVDENLEDNTLVYPNPANDFVTVRVAKDATFKLLDVNGKLVLSRPLRKGENRLNIHNLQKGVYIGRIVSGDDLHSFRLVVH